MEQEEVGHSEQEEVGHSEQEEVGHGPDIRKFDYSTFSGKVQIVAYFELFGIVGGHSNAFTLLF
jgi:hypothetical protein